MSDDLKDSEIADVLTDIIKRRPVSTLQAERGMEELRNLVTALKAEEKRGDLHADLNRQAAQALGKPFAGDGSSWHDIPECIAALRAENERLRKVEQAHNEYRRVAGGLSPAELVAAFDRILALQEETFSMRLRLQKKK